MNVGQALRTAIRNLAAHKGRFAQAMLGMVVGVAGVVFVLCVSGSLLNLGELEDEEYSSSLLLVRVMTNVELSKRITPADMEQAARDNPEVIKAVSPLINFELTGGVRYGDKTPEAAYLEGVGEQYIDMLPVLRLADGRFLQPMDISREQNVCVVGSGIANELMGGGALGQELKIYGESYTVVGVLQSVPKLAEYDWVLYLPYSNAKKLVEQATSPYYPYNATMYYDRYFVDANGQENMYKAITTMEDMIEKRMGMGKNGAWELLATSMKFLSGNIKDTITTTALQGMVGAIIILLVGGFGIMNVMQAVVQERTKEIGIRKAFGATDRDIRRQFRLEAIIISLLGGFVGIVLGLLGTYLACIYSLPISVARGVYYSPGLAYLDLPIVPVLAAVAASVLVGVIFGTYPARQAAKMEPVAAINAN